MKKKVIASLIAFIIASAGSIFLMLYYINDYNYLYKILNKLFFRFLGGGGMCSGTWLTSRVQFILTLLLTIFFIILILFVILYLIKFLRSKGNQSRIVNGQKFIKTVFICSVLIFIVTIIGLIFFSTNNSPQNYNYFQTCINAPQSNACKNCGEKGESGIQCMACENSIISFCRSNAPNNLESNSSWEDIKHTGNYFQNNCE